jgi:tRNA threonylcarbamoyladenosine biosynthesis protein TsaE
MPTITVEKEATMIALGKHCAKQLTPPFVCYLMGDLGAGKTTWMKGILKGLGSKERLTSPTYPIVKRYQIGNKSLIHFDLYRLNGIDDFIDSGLTDELELADYLFIEWPMRAKACLPPPDIELTFEVSRNHHLVTMDSISFKALGLSTFTE